MSDRDRYRRAMVDDIADEAAMVSALVARVHNGSSVFDRMRQAVPGLPAQRFEASTRSSMVADPTGTAALAEATDRATADLRMLDRVLVQAKRAVDELLRLVDRYPPPHVGATDRLLAEAEADAEPGCWSCARVPGPAGTPRWEPPIAGLGATDVGGRLDVPRLLCWWCYDRARLWGRLPTEEELQAHHSGKRVRWPSNVPRPPDPKRTTPETAPEGPGRRPPGGSAPTH